MGRAEHVHALPAWHAASHHHPPPPAAAPASAVPATYLWCCTHMSLRWYSTTWLWCKRAITSQLAHTCAGVCVRRRSLWSSTQARQALHLGLKLLASQGHLPTQHALRATRTHTTGSCKLHATWMMRSHRHRCVSGSAFRAHNPGLLRPRGTMPAAAAAVMAAVHSTVWCDGTPSDLLHLAMMHAGQQSPGCARRAIFS